MDSSAGGGAGEASSPDRSSILNTLDFSAIEELDPSLGDGYKIMYDRECPFEMRLQESSEEGPTEVGTLEAVRVKILVKEDLTVKVELTSEADLFFNYQHTADTETFPTIQAEQKLMIELADYPNVLASSLNSAIKEPHCYLAVLVMSRDGHARLDVIHNVQFKFVELLSVEFTRGSDEQVRQSIAYRYNSMKSRLALMQNRLSEVSNLVKLKSPSLLLQIQKPGRGDAGRGGGGAGAGGGGRKPVFGSKSSRFT